MVCEHGARLLLSLSYATGLLVTRFLKPYFSGPCCLPTGAIPDSFQLESNLYPATPPKKPSGDDAGLSSTSSRVLIVLVAVAVLVTLIFVYVRRRRLAQQQALNEAHATRLTDDAFDVNMRNRGLSSGSGDHSDDPDAHMPLSGRPPSSRESSRNAPQSGNPDPLGHLAYA